MQPEGSIPKQISVGHFCWNPEEVLASQKVSGGVRPVYGAQMSAPVTPTVETESRYSISNEDSSVRA